MVERIPMGRMGEPRRGRGARLLAGQRGVLVLDGRDLRHLRRKGRLLSALRPLPRAGRGRRESAEARRVVTSSPRASRGRAARRRDASRSRRPVRAPRSRSTRRRSGAPASRTSASRDARVEESAVKDVYTLVYDAQRPELFLKDAACRRTVGPGRADRDPRRLDLERARARDRRRPRRATGAIAGLTIGNDVSSRDIEGANPLYLPQAKVYAGACAIGPAVYVPDDLDAPLAIQLRVTDAVRPDRLRGRDVDRAHAPLVRGARRVAARATTPCRPAASS